MSKLAPKLSLFVWTNLVCSSINTNIKVVDKELPKQLMIAEMYK
jgi:hypothetical protein